MARSRLGACGSSQEHAKAVRPSGDSSRFQGPSLTLRVAQLPILTRCVSEGRPEITTLNSRTPSHKGREHGTRPPGYSRSPRGAAQEVSELFSCARRNSGFVAAAVAGTLDVAVVLRRGIAVRAEDWFESKVQGHHGNRSAPGTRSRRVQKKIPAVVGTLFTIGRRDSGGTGHDL